MADYWVARMKSALAECRDAPSRETEAVYLRLAEHYRAMARVSRSQRQVGQTL